MHPNQVTLEKLYNAFTHLDVDTMASCYAADAEFDDEAFSLRGREQIMGMWRMLCETAKAKALADWRLVYSGIEVTDTTGKAHWKADYAPICAPGGATNSRVPRMFAVSGNRTRPSVRENCASVSAKCPLGAR